MQTDSNWISVNLSSCVWLRFFFLSLRVRKWVCFLLYHTHARPCAVTIDHFLKSMWNWCGDLIQPKYIYLSSSPTHLENIIYLYMRQIKTLNNTLILINSSKRVLHNQKLWLHQYSIEWHQSIYIYINIYTQTK